MARRQLGSEGGSLNNVLVIPKLQIKLKYSNHDGWAWLTPAVWDSGN